MKKITALFAFIFLFFASFALCENVYIRNAEIVYADVCPAGFEPFEGKLTLGAGENFAIFAEAEKFASSNTKIVTVDANGIVTAVSKGTAVLRTYFSQDEYDDLEVVVKKAPDSVSISRKNGVMNIGTNYRLTHSLPKDSAGTVIWSSSDPGIVSVDKTGYLTANGLGECIITAQTYNGHTAECSVKVNMPAPATVRLSAEKGTMYVGETHLLGCTLEGGYMESVFWSSSDESIVSVTEEGLLAAHSEGSCIITASASGGNSAECTVTVLPGPFSITVSDKPIVLYENGRIKIKPEIKGGSGKYEIYSMDETLLVIDEETGEIHARRAGEAYILFITPNYLLAECTVNIVSAPESITLTAEENIFATGENTRLFLNLDGYEALPVTYEVDSPGILTVSENGTATGVAPGKAVVTAYTGGRQAITELEIQPIATAMRLSNDKPLMGVGDHTTIRALLTGGAGRITFTSDNPSVAGIDPRTGVLTALSEGESIITARLVNGVGASCAVRVAPAPNEFSLKNEKIVLGANDAHALSYSMTDGAAASVTFTVSDANLLKIDGGMLYALSGHGEAFVHAKTHNGLTSVMRVEVKEPAERIRVNCQSLSSHDSFDSFLQLKKGDFYPLMPECDGYSGQLFTYHSTYPAIADIDETGLICALKQGTSLITVSLHSGAAQRILVIVE